MKRERETKRARKAQTQPISPPQLLKVTEATAERHLIFFSEEGEVEDTKRAFDIWQAPQTTRVLNLYVIATVSLQSTLFLESS